MYSYQIILFEVLLSHYLLNMVSPFSMYNFITYTSLYVWSVSIQGGPSSVRPQQQVKYNCLTAVSRYWNVLYLCILPHHTAAPLFAVGFVVPTMLLSR